MCVIFHDNLIDSHLKIKMKFTEYSSFFKKDPKKTQIYRFDEFIARWFQWIRFVGQAIQKPIAECGRIFLSITNSMNIMSVWPFACFKWKPWLNVGRLNHCLEECCISRWNHCQFYRISGLWFGRKPNCELKIVLKESSEINMKMINRICCDILPYMRQFRWRRVVRWVQLVW